ncbi:hypothetical protein COCNU_scaffold001223G000020 [Cocos nucifera]|nr:hypothetical protein [Cocos nucifera]
MAPPSAAATSEATESTEVPHPTKVPPVAKIDVAGGLVPLASTSFPAKDHPIEREGREKKKIKKKSTIVKEAFQKGYELCEDRVAGKFFELDLDFLYGDIFDEEIEPSAITADPCPAKATLDPFKPTVEAPKPMLEPEAARLLGPPTSFEASKLKVVFKGEEMDKQPLGITTRAYTLTHCDFTANLTLAVSNSISGDKVLKAVVHGDSVLFSKHPELMEAKVWVYFHSKSKRYNRVECWGPLKNATQRTYNIRSVESQTAVAAETKKWADPEQVLHALVAFLL